MNQGAQNSLSVQPGTIMKGYSNMVDSLSFSSTFTFFPSPFSFYFNCFILSSPIFLNEAPEYLLCVGKKQVSFFLHNFTTPVSISLYFSLHLPDWCELASTQGPHMIISQNVIKIVVQSLSNVQLFANPWTTVCQASLSFTSSLSLCKLIHI